ncbi:hypothetical protein EMIHUDRAFT_444348, partial [Emiliania huxleyi CCMP1516]
APARGVRARRGRGRARDADGLHGGDGSQVCRHRDRRRGVARGRGLRVRRKLERCPLSRPTEVPTEGRSRGEERRPGRCQAGGGSPSASSPRDHGGYCSVARLVVRLGVGALVERL